MVKLSRNPGVYAIFSKALPIVYVGSTTNIQRRWWSHKSDLKTGRRRNVKLQEHFDQYGLEDLEFVPLTYFDKETEKLEQVLKDEENKQLDNHRALGFTPLNDQQVVAGGWCPPERRKAISDAAKSRNQQKYFHTEEAKRKNQESLNRFRQTPEGKEQIQKMVQAAFTPEAKAKRAETLKRQATTNEGREKIKGMVSKAIAKTSKPVILTKDGVEYPYASASEAARDLGVTTTMIQRVLKGQAKSTKGFSARYA